MTLGEHEVDYVWVSNFYGVEIDPTVDFQLSQRADHIVKTISSRVRFNRAIINPKWDSYYTLQQPAPSAYTVRRKQHERICVYAEGRHDESGA